DGGDVVGQRAGGVGQGPDGAARGAVPVLDARVDLAVPAPPDDVGLGGRVAPAVARVAAVGLLPGDGDALPVLVVDLRLPQAVAGGGADEGVLPRDRVHRRLGRV